MPLTLNDVKKIGHLARLNFTAADSELYLTQLSHILEFVEQINQTDTTGVEPLSHPIPNLTQRMRKDVVTSENQRDTMQTIAPQVEAGLYLVPKVIEEA